MKFKIIKNMNKKDVINSMMNIEPKKVINYFVKIGDKNYPPKQVISEVFKIHKIFFTTIDAIEFLGDLGFSIGWMDKKKGRIMINIDNQQGRHERLQGRVRLP